MALCREGRGEVARMDQLWVLVLQLLITPAAIAAAIVWFGKGLVSQLLARDLEQYRHREQRETEQHKQMLGFINFERQTRFSWAHEKEAEAIAELYGKLGAAHRKVALM